MADVGVKQVIVYRRDLGMRKGKIAAQCTHAVKMILFDLGKVHRTDPILAPPTYGTRWGGNIRRKATPVLAIPLDEHMEAWVTGKFTAVVLTVENEADLLRIYNLAGEAGIHRSLVRDAGKTEFKKECPECGGAGATVTPSGECTEWLMEVPPSIDPCNECEGTGKVSVPTHTAVAIGPAPIEVIDAITGPGGAVTTKLA